MSRLVLVLVCYSNLLYGDPVCTEEHKINVSEQLGKIYGFIERVPEEPIRVNDTVTHLLNGEKIEKNEVIAKSQLHIECPPDTSFYDLDKPLPNGWLYPKFYENTEEWKKYFDTGKNEYWVFPNVYCDKEKRRLTAMSWMRSGKKFSHNGNGGMHIKFKNNKPSFDSSNVDDGVYCLWDGWLYPTTKFHYSSWFDTEDHDESFTLINVYCRNQRVRYLHRKVAGHELNIPAKHPFKGLATPAYRNDNLVRCNWQGWLYKALFLEDEWKEGNATRWSYERYFIINSGGTDKSNKAIHGRVMNPYCSPSKDTATIGVVTAIRAYCFYPSSGNWHGEKKSMCDDLDTSLD